MSKFAAVAQPAFSAFGHFPVGAFAAPVPGLNVLTALQAISAVVGVISGVKGLTQKPPSQSGFSQIGSPALPEKTRPDVNAAGLSSVGNTTPAIGFSGLSPLQEATNIFTAGVGGPGQIDPQFSRDPFGNEQATRAHNALIQMLESGASPDAPAIGVGAQYAKKAGFPLQGEQTTRSLVSSLQELLARG